jgi:hypothetical protein
VALSGRARGGGVTSASDPFQASVVSVGAEAGVLPAPHPQAKLFQRRCLNQPESAVAVCLVASWEWSREA